MCFKVQSTDDIRTLAGVASGIWHEYWQNLLSSVQIDYMVAKFQSENAINIQIVDEGYQYFFINSGSNKAGYFAVCIKQQEDIGYLFLSKIYIKKEFRGTGLGRKAFKEIKQIAAQLAVNLIRLTVNKYNANTIAAYEKWGFATIDECVIDIGNGFVMDDYIMEYVL